MLNESRGTLECELRLQPGITAVMSLLRIARIVWKSLTLIRCVERQAQVLIVRRGPSHVAWAGVQRLLRLRKFGIRIPMLPGSIYIIRHEAAHRRDVCARAPVIEQGILEAVSRRVLSAIRLCESESPISQRSTRQVQAETRIRIFAADLHTRDSKKISS